MSSAQFHDPDLTPLLRRCTEEQLEPLVEYLTSPATSRFGAKTAELEYDTALARRVDDIVIELSAFGGNTFANVLRSGGIGYADILNDVCKKMKVTDRVDATVQTREADLLTKVLGDAYARMSEEERAELQAIFAKAGLGNVDLSGGIPLSIVLAQAGIQMTGFLAYQIAVIVANAVARALLGRGLSLGANAALTRSLGVFAGPVGWAVSGIWTAVDLSGPAYRVTIPCVCHIAMLRALDAVELA